MNQRLNALVSGVKKEEDMRRGCLKIILVLNYFYYEKCCKKIKIPKLFCQLPKAMKSESDAHLLLFTIKRGIYH